MPRDYYRLHLLEHARLVRQVHSGGQLPPATLAAAFAAAATLASALSSAAFIAAVGAALAAAALVAAPAPPLPDRRARIFRHSD